MGKYFKVWRLLTMHSFSIATISRFGALLFMTGKIIRFFFFLSFLFLLLTKTEALVGFSIWQVVFFFLTFNLIDSVSQFFFREVYRFRQQVVTGTFDLVLIKPVSPLFRSLFGGADFLDLITLIPLAGFMIYAAGKLGPLDLGSIVLYLVLVLNGFILALSFHIFVLSIAILTTEIDHTIMIYRDLTQMGRVPIDIYNEFLRALLTFVIPIGIMMTFPVKALIGLLNPQTVLISFLVTGLFLYTSLFLWRYSLRHYSSASS